MDKESQIVSRQPVESNLENFYIYIYIKLHWNNNQCKVES
jgi:hypothetical protein